MRARDIQDHAQNLDQGHCRRGGSLPAGTWDQPGREARGSEPDIRSVPSPLGTWNRHDMGTAMVRQRRDHADPGTYVPGR